MKVENVFNIILLQTMLCCAQRQPMTELYITPRNVTYGWYDNGVFQFKIEKTSIRAAYANRTFNSISVKDSVYELFYTKVQIPNILYKNLTPLKNTRADIKRIMIIPPDKDTFFIDRNYNITKGGRCYQIGSSLQKLIENYMPDEIKENWVNNLSGR